ncbi:DUF3052 domain-containing protein [Hoeflea ulvae]|uniref:DUF3052 domain-containing protein n=1 Tax=Hoeflea ulvae TaxID=2983764 RepID=A0ABT3YJS4_9HYPH|nr:DUF3052 domain-containing protein [Hoeflea ulvae]MCY0096141.1 DUF3052 domain-containing protein [Hoeflea ulvae]
MAGYSATPLVRKLGLQPAQRALLIAVPDNLHEISGFDSFAACDTVWDGISVYDLVMVFETGRDGLKVWAERLPHLVQRDGMVWIAWPKKASRRPTTLSGDVLRSVLLPTGLVDVKVCAIDAVWSGLKFVVRKQLRPDWPG